MKYISTRGDGAVDAAHALVRGIAADGGLYLPEALPTVDADEWLALDFAGIYRKILTLFFDGLPESTLDAATKAVVSAFDTPEIVPLKSAGGVHFLELFHGPTRAFKDVALMALPHLLTAAASQCGIKKIAVLTATSGDTGSAAMNGFSGVEGTEILVFYPAQGISEIQRRQMVCQDGSNVHACAIDGNFDDAQRAVKTIFNDSAIRARAETAGVSLSSANSINIGRLFPQMSYYINTWRNLLKSGELQRDEFFDITVPTGNFGNILAACYAKRLGVPIRRMVVASNRNCVVADFIATGTYDTHREFSVTNSPSMDILVSSNTERLLFELAGRSSERLTSLMRDLTEKGSFSLNDVERDALQREFASGSVTPEATESAIRELWENHGYLADPHTAVGWAVAREYAESGIPMVVAATASPWKFPETMVRALCDTPENSDFANLRKLSEMTTLSADLAGLENAPIRHDSLTARDQAADMVCRTFNL